MNILKTDFNGGMSLELDDLRWMQDGPKIAIKNLVSFLGDSFYIAKPTFTGVLSTSLLHSSAMMVLHGEVCEILGINVPINNVALPFLYWEIEEGGEVTGIETFENGSAHVTYIIRRAKLVGYATAQPGKPGIILPSAYDLINTNVENTAHHFTKRQSLAQSNGSIFTTPGSGIIPINPGEGNVYYVNIDGATVPLIRFSVPFPDGTWMAIRFTAGSNFRVRIGDGGNLNNAIATRNRTFEFEYMQIAWFIWVDGKAVLVNGVKEVADWHYIGSPGEPALQSTWINSASLRFRKDEVGRVTLQGNLNNNHYTTGGPSAFTLPSGFTPAQTYTCHTKEIFFLGWAQITISTGGVVSVWADGKTDDPTGVSLDGISFYAD